MILVVGQRDDPHVASVTQELLNNRCDFVILDSFGVDSDGPKWDISPSAAISIEGKSFRPYEIQSVWWRQKPRFIVPNESAKDLYDYYFLHREWNHLIEFLTSELNRAFNINNPEVEKKANNKIFQIKLAEELGFRVPNTLISNDYGAIKKFIDGCGGKFIFKTLTPYMSPSGMAAYTTLINQKMLEDRKESLKIVPGIFQKFIKKSFELRVTIVGDEVFSVRINSNYSEATEVDWRQQIFDDIYSVHTLTHELHSHILSLHHRFGLYYGAYDLVIDDDENCFFMEVNPAGQWMWLEQALGLPISKRIADALVRCST